MYVGDVGFLCVYLTIFSFDPVSSQQQRREHVIIGTSGTMLDWILKKRVVDTKNVAMFVLDEADIMIDQQGQQDQTIRIQK